MTCWMALGNDVRTVLTTSLPAGPTTTTVQLAYSVAVIFTFPLQNYPALEIACRSVAAAIDKCKACKHFSTSRDDVQHKIISSVLVMLLAVVAVTTMERLDKVVSFLGGLLGCPIAFIFPPLIHLQLAGRAGKLSQGRKIMDILVALLGLVAMVVSTATTLLRGA
jgi:solute carrier family 36 (proton-coupled amino acid transporter)